MGKRHKKDRERGIKRDDRYIVSEIEGVASSLPDLSEGRKPAGKFLENRLYIPRDIEVRSGEDESDSSDLEDILAASELSGREDDEEYAGVGRSGPAMINYFDFEKNPFGDSLDTTFFYKSAQHNDALTNMLTTIEQDISFGLIYGKSGTGKTLLSQAILEKLSPQRFLPVLVPVTPGLSRSAFLKILLEGFGYEDGNFGRDINSMINLIEDCILDLYKSGIKPVVMIDECHFLSSQALHILRTLTNIEAFNKKLITCILFAEENFMRRLKNPYFSSLKNRIYFEIELKNLSESDLAEYVKFRLMMAGNEEADFFNTEELKEIFKKSQGIPRNINKECTKIMLDRYLKQKR